MKEAREQHPGLRGSRRERMLEPEAGSSRADVGVGAAGVGDEADCAGAGRGAQYGEAVCGGGSLRAVSGAGPAREVGGTGDVAAGAVCAAPGQLRRGAAGTATAAGRTCRSSPRPPTCSSNWSQGATSAAASSSPATAPCPNGAWSSAMPSPPLPSSTACCTTATSSPSAVTATVSKTSVAPGHCSSSPPSQPHQPFINPRRGSVLNVARGSIPGVA